VAGIYNGLFVMSDRQTGSVWTHYDGTILTGPLTESGLGMEIEPILHLRWSDWLDRYPASSVLAWDENFADRYEAYEPGQAGLGPEFVQTLLPLDERLPESELVLGVDTGTASTAYVLGDAEGLTVLNEEVGDLAVVVIIDRASLFGIAYEATVDGIRRRFHVEPGLEAGQEKGQIVDDTGALWALDGSALDGSGPDGQLVFVTSFVTEWYGWAAYHPETEIYDRGPRRSSGAAFPGRSAPWSCSWPWPARADRRAWGRRQNRPSGWSSWTIRVRTRALRGRPGRPRLSGRTNRPIPVTARN
jgi:Protein of unknown function (DUF3179)